MYSPEGVNLAPTAYAATSQRKQSKQRVNKGVQDTIVSRIYRKAPYWNDSGGQWVERVLGKLQII